jgi:uncharacterized Ntn-hydrolase superfamily protein
MRVRLLTLNGTSDTKTRRTRGRRIGSAWLAAGGVTLDTVGSMRVDSWALGLLACVIGLAAWPAHATYSVAAADMTSREVGGAITSCVGSLDLSLVYGSLPGVGVIHAQALLDMRSRGKNRALQLLMQGLAPSEILAQITMESFDADFASRQYGLVDTQGRSAGFTGARAQAYKHDQQASRGGFVYSVQGNILTSQKVLDQAAAAFEASSCDLAERLMRALEAGADHGEGDSRCTSGGIPSDAAFIEVDRPGETAGSYLRLSVSDTGPDSPLPKLRTMFDAWRKTHPCTMPASASAGSGGGSAGRGGAAGLGATGGVGAAAGNTGTTVSNSGATAGTAGAADSGGAPSTEPGVPPPGLSAAAATSDGVAGTGHAGTSASGRAALSGAGTAASTTAAGTSGQTAAPASQTSAPTNAGTSAEPSTSQLTNPQSAAPSPAAGSGCSLSQPSPTTPTWQLLLLLFPVALLLRLARHYFGSRKCGAAHPLVTRSGSDIP